MSIKEAVIRIGDGYDEALNFLRPGREDCLLCAIAVKGFFSALPFSLPFFDRSQPALNGSHTTDNALMPTSVLVLYPPPSLSAARVARDLADQHYSPHPLRWLNLQEDPSDSVRSSTPNRSGPTFNRLSRINILVEPTGGTQTALGGRSDKSLFSSSAITPGPSTRRVERSREILRARKSSRNVTFDLTHEIAAIPVFEASLDDVEEDPTTIPGKTISDGVVPPSIENSGFLGQSGFPVSKRVSTVQLQLTGDISVMCRPRKSESTTRCS